ncbi:MAG TPA: heme-binding protein [Bryobacteraceae bacterium]|nr:heme-binding protein [Bryobacteraceae bacterium]
MKTTEHIFRAAGPSTAANLGLLHKLPGRWVGKGFNLIARPARLGIPANPPFFLELNATSETLEFTAIGGDIPNRGETEPTALLHAVTYLQSVTDCANKTGIHKEPGLWVRVPATAENPSETYVRQATIPHGDSLLAQSTFFATVQGGPTIDPVNSLPFPLSDAIPALTANPANPIGGAYINPYLQSVLPGECLPSGLDPAATIKDPTEVLRADIKDQTIHETDVIAVSTSPVGGIVNIPFVVQNANAVRLDAIFWIETVKHIFGTVYFQLQYVQRVILDFDNIHWPHVSVATLVKE